MKRRKLGDILVSSGKLSESRLQEALSQQKTLGKKLGKILTECGWITEEGIARAISEQLGLQILDFSLIKNIDTDVLALVPVEYAQSHALIPVEQRGKELTLAMADPLDYTAIQALEFRTGLRVRVVIGLETEIQRQLQKYTNLNEIVANLSKSLSPTEGAEVINEAEEQEDLIKGNERGPIVGLVNAVFEDALRKRASDIHIEPQEGDMQVRFRVDGLLKNILTVPKYIQPSVISRMKVMANLDISNRRSPQDGRMKLRVGGKIVDLRVSTLPTINGEKVVIRILDQSQATLSLDSLGFEPEMLKKFKDTLSHPQGLVLVTGPTGSGKTTTLYSALNFLKGSVANIVTVEDPVEYKIDGINQVQTNERAGVTFVTALRSILRQDPNVILIGEIRDRETADIAFRSAQTGHLVLSTLHTNDAAAAVTRLLDIGLESFIMASSLSGILAQRLVRRICEHCKEPDTPDRSILARFDLDPDDTSLKFFKGKGCERCGMEGFKGRLGVHEFLVVDDFVRLKISAKAQDREILEPARNAGMKNMAEDGMAKALQGLTTLEEILHNVPWPEFGREKSPFKEVVVGPSVAVPGYTPIAAARPRARGDQEFSRSEYEIETPVDYDGTLEPVFDPATDERPDRRGRHEDEEDEPIPRRRPGRDKRRIARDRILVIDDSPTVVRMVQEFLEAEDFEVVTARDGIEGLEKVYAEAPDLIVTDAMMPRMDGFTLVKKLKEHLSTRLIPIIMLTSREETASEVQGLELGADDYITKPLEPERLLVRIKRVLMRSR
jgi:type IV pilus assembly protein PilB